MTIDPAQFEMTRLLGAMLAYQWQRECEIIPDYMPPYPRHDTKPTCVVKHGDSFLRYSCGPGTGTFWDVYGDNFLNPELALVELSKAHPPTGNPKLWPATGALSLKPKDTP